MITEEWLRKKMCKMVECYRHYNQLEGEKRLNELIRVIMKKKQRDENVKR